MMRYSELTNPTLDEAPMNPGEFNKAIDTGHGQGVLVGFEFECFVPEKTLNMDRGEKITPAYVEQTIVDNYVLNSKDVIEITPEEFDGCFKMKRPGKYPNMSVAYKAFMDEKHANLKATYEKIPEKFRLKYAKKAMKDAHHFSRESPEMGFAKSFVNDASWPAYRAGAATEKAVDALEKYTYKTKWSAMLEFVFGVDRDGHVGVSQYFTFDPKAAWELLGLADFVDSDYDDYEDYPNYNKGTKVLKPELEKAMNAHVIVFQEYHEKKKNMTSWYIEPDGSLNPNSDQDAIAEIVSPPLPAKDAVAALKNFYAMAGRLGIYTNDTTGLHINVSIPAKLDLLKLAVFTGDLHVLKQFGREDSHYADSSERNVRKDAPDAGLTQVGRGKKQTTKLDMKYLLGVAKEHTEDHMASISYNGKWVSFRHAGGDYLSDYTSIFNVVGRFVRAMIIASDPTLYANEYKTALAKMSQPVTDAGFIDTIRTQGVPAIEMSVYRNNQRTRFDLLAKKSLDDGEYSYIVTPNSVPAREEIVSKLDSGFPALEEKIRKGNIANCATVLVIPGTQEDIDTLKGMNMSRAEHVIQPIYTSWRGQKAGYGIYKRVTIPANDPRVAKLILSLRKQQLKGKKPAPAVRSSGRQWNLRL
jgi:hypothetical protein